MGLSNLYYIDPEDQEILRELREVRLQTVDLMLSVSRDELARQFQADFGDRFWAMAQSGVQKVNLDANESNKRDSLQQWLSETPQSLHQDGGIQRFAAVLLFNAPGSVRLADPDSNLPAVVAAGATSGSARWHRAESKIVRILFVHCNYPAQFRHLCRHFAAKPEHEVVFLCQNKEWTAGEVEGFSLARYQLGRDPQGQQCHPYLRRYEAAVLHGQAALREAMRLRQQGFNPDLIIGHSGFGNTLYLKEVWPQAKFLGYFEWYYKSQGADVGFGNEAAPSPDTCLRVHTYNSPIVMDLVQSDAAICPTRWQAEQFPAAIRNHLNVIFDGIDTERLPLVTPDSRMGSSLFRKAISGL